MNPISPSDWRIHAQNRSFDLATDAQALVIALDEGADYLTIPTLDNIQTALVRIQQAIKLNNEREAEIARSKQRAA